MDDIVFERRKGRRAEASTAQRICQKCLHNTHWTYECLNSKVYLRRPSKTEEIKNLRIRTEVVIEKPPEQRELEQLEKEVRIMREMKEKKKIKKLKREAKILEKEAKRLKREKTGQDDGKNVSSKKQSNETDKREEIDESESSSSGDSTEDDTEGVQRGVGEDESSGCEEWVEEEKK